MLKKGKDPEQAKAERKRNPNPEPEKKKAEKSDVKEVSECLAETFLY